MLLSAQVLEAKPLQCPRRAPQRLSVGRLSTLMACRREAARLYADARRGNLPVQDARALASVIRILVEIIELAELEPRLAALERAQP